MLMDFMADPDERLCVLVNQIACLNLQLINF